MVVRRVRREVEHPTPYHRYRLYQTLQSLHLLYHYDVGALMGLPRLHLLDRGGWVELLKGRTSPGALRALDVGAGSGFLLREFAPLFSKVVATEISRVMVWRLGQQPGVHAQLATTGGVRGSGGDDEG
eukprot:COSAG01_NODE_9224_length_2514_cov_1.278675_2_plen_128_part_00